MKKTILILAFALLAAVSLTFVACDSAKTPEDTNPDTTVTTDAPTEPDTEAPTEPGTEAPTEPGTEAPGKGCGSAISVCMCVLLPAVAAAMTRLRKRETEIVSRGK